MTPQTVNAYYNPLQNEIVFPAGYPAAAVLRHGRRRRGELRRDRLGHRPRDRPRLRRPGLASSTATATCESGGPTRTARKFDDAHASRLIEQYNGYCPLTGPVPQRRADARREHRRPRRPRDRVQGATRSRSAASAAPVIDGLTGDQRFFMGFAQVRRMKLRDEFLRHA